MFKLDIRIKCPDWYQHSTDYIDKLENGPDETAVRTLGKFIYECLTCSVGYYTVSRDEVELKFSLKDNMSIPDTKECIQCPYGATCTGNNIVPRPNYWGHWNEERDALNFTQCPPSYCCAGNADAPCNAFDVCAPNRAGTLCGLCKEGLSVSVLTGECIPDSECEDDFLFWMFAIPIAFGYALWYTFKREILSYFLLIILPVLSRIDSWFRKKDQYHSTSSKENNLNPTPYTRRENRFRKDKMNLKGIQSENGSGSSNNINSDPEQGPGSNIKKQQSKSKGYFDIVTFYVQMSAAIAIAIEFSDIDDSKSVLDYISDNIDRVLNFALSDITIKFCPISELSTRGKHISVLAFLCSVYVAWGLIYTCLSFLWLCFRCRSASRGQDTLNSAKLKFIAGLVDIIKYTYEGFCEVIFLSLICVEINNTHVWWYDASQECLEIWQIGMLIFALVFALPFPFALFLAMKYLEQKRISPFAFFLCCLCPLLGIVFMVLCSYCCKPSDGQLSKSSEKILYTLQGPFRKDPKHATLYWEAVISVRRLLITGMTLLKGFGSVRMVVLSCLCVTFLIHHNYRMPFQYRTSNHVETLSLSLLSIFCIFNLLKASLTDFGVVPEGPTVDFFKAVEFIEKLFPIILIVVIVIIEVRRRFKKKSKSQ